jgi:hypothetical protein
MTQRERERALSGTRLHNGRLLCERERERESMRERERERVD